MAVTSSIYPTAIGRLFTAEIDLDTDDLKVALVDNSAAYSSADSIFDDVSSTEITGTGYSAGGVTLTGVSVDSNDDIITLNADDATWPTSTLSAYGAVVYADLATPYLICFIDFNDEAATTAEDFVIDFSAGVLTATAGAA